MFKSGTNASDFLSDIKSEAEIAPEISDTKYLSWINSLEQILYSDVIKEQHEKYIDSNLSSTIFINEETRPEDIFAVYYNGKELKKTTLLSSVIFDNIWYIKDGEVFYKTANKDENSGQVRVLYYARPEVKTVFNYEKAEIMLPPEFIDLMYAYVRAEAYKYSNEDILSAKWQAEFNARLETFKTWIDSRRANFGV